MTSKNFKPLKIYVETHRKLKHKSADVGLSLAQMVDLMADMDDDEIEELKHKNMMKRKRGFF